MDYGHHFAFTNNLGITIDSLEFIVGDSTTWVYPNPDFSDELEANVSVPVKGYPHLVTIRVYEDGVIRNLTADVFDCFNCDGSHEYILEGDSAKYKFHY